MTPSSLMALTRPACPANIAACQVKLRAAAVLDRGVALLDRGGNPDELTEALAELHRAWAEIEQGATASSPWPRVAAAAGSTAADEEVREIVSSLEPSFRAQELTFAVTQSLPTSPWRRRRAARLAGTALGPPASRACHTLSAARQRAGSHLEGHGVAAQQASACHRSLAWRSGGQIDRRPALLLGRARHPVGVAFQRPQHRPERPAGPARHRRRVRDRCRHPRRSSAPTPRCCGWCSRSWSSWPASPRLPFLRHRAGSLTLVLVILFNIVQPTGWRVGLLRVETSP